MESFLGICIARMLPTMNFMINAMHALGVLYLDNPVIFHWRMPYYAERDFTQCEQLRLFGDLQMEIFEKHIAQATFKRSFTVGTNAVMASSFSPLFLMMACLHLCMAQ